MDTRAASSEGSAVGQIEILLICLMVSSQDCIQIQKGAGPLCRALVAGCILFRRNLPLGGLQDHADLGIMDGELLLLSRMVVKCCLVSALEINFDVITSTRGNNR